MAKKRKMRPGGGAAKGGAYERKLARSLSTWWFGKEGFLWRRPGSGFRARMPGLHTGDIVPNADRPLPNRWPFHVEAKCYAKSRLKLSNLLWPNRNPIQKIWKKAVKERRKDLVPILILKANNTDPVGVMREKDGDRLMKCLNIDCSFLFFLSGYAVISNNMKAPIVVFSWKEVQNHPRSGSVNFDEPIKIKRREVA